MGDIRLKVLGAVFLLSLLILIWPQHKLNSEISNQLTQTRTELSNLKESIANNVESQNIITSDLNDLKTTQYKSQNTFAKKLVEIKNKPKEEKTVILNTEYKNILECIEKTSLGEQCE